MIEATSLGQDPMMQRAIASYRENMAYGGYVEELTPLIRAIKSMQDSDPRIDELRVRPRDDQAAQDQANIDAAESRANETTRPLTSSCKMTCPPGELYRQSVEGCRWRGSERVASRPRQDTSLSS